MYECEPICDWSFDQFGFLIGRPGNTALPLVDTNPALVTPLTHSRMIIGDIGDTTDTHTYMELQTVVG